MTYNCLLVDDEPFALELLEHHIARVDNFRVVAACRNTEDAFKILAAHTIDLMFLDIRMPGKDGIRFLSELKQPPQVILTTAYRDYALDGYDLGAIDYLLKPISFVRFSKAVEKFLALRQPAWKIPEAPSAGNTTILLKSGHEQHVIEPQDILLLESRREYIRILLKQQQPILIRATVQQMIGYLPPGQFIQVHKSYIVPLKNITAINARSIQLGSQSVPFGRTYKKSVEQALGRQDC